MAAARTVDSLLSEQPAGHTRCWSRVCTPTNLITCGTEAFLLPLDPFSHSAVTGALNSGPSDTSE